MAEGRAWGPLTSPGPQRIAPKRVKWPKGNTFFDNNTTVLPRQEKTDQGLLTKNILLVWHMHQGQFCKMNTIIRILQERKNVNINMNEHWDCLRYFSRYPQCS